MTKYQKRLDFGDRETMNKRLETLKRVSGLLVTGYTIGGAKYYVFGPENRPVKTVCTYRKARVFAEGLAIGRTL